jgi:ATP-dependent exoDNAse (exonuclease V) beta subunit
VSCYSCGGKGGRQSRVQVQQELNLLYVALTRSRREMYFVGDVPKGLRDEW